MKYCHRDSSPCQLNHKKLASNRSSHNKSLHTDEKVTNNHQNAAILSYDIKVRKNHNNTDNKVPMTHHDTDIEVTQNHRLLKSAGAGYYSEFAPVNIHSKLQFRLNIIKFSSISNVYSSSDGKKPFRFKFACKISKFFEIVYPRYSLCSVGAGNRGNHAHD